MSVPLKTILIFRGTFPSLILPHQPPYPSLNTKAYSFLWVIRLSCLHRPEHSSPNWFSYFFLSFKNLLKCYFLKFPHSTLFKVATWLTAHHLLYSHYQLSFSHNLLLSNAQYLPIYIFVIDVYPPQPIGKCQEAEIFVSFTNVFLVTGQRITPLSL